MQVLYARSCGIDVHKKNVVATVILTHEDGTTTRITQTFSTMTDGLLTLEAWLEAQGITHIALESTGVYWRPVYQILETEERTLLLVNPQHMKAVPGRKTDVKDSEWLAELLRHGLLKASFIPPAPIRAVRELTRYRKTLTRERSQEVQRVHKVLESAHIKLASVATDVLGVSGTKMLEAIIQGTDDPVVLAELAQGKLRPKIPVLRRALDGRVQSHHRVLLQTLLDHIAFLEERIAQLQKAIQEELAPLSDAVARLTTIPGIQEVAATAIVAELGVEMSRFPTSKHLASWAGLCPGNRESGGKRLPAKMTHGNPWLRAMVGEVAHSITHTKDNYLVAFYQRMVRRRGKYKALGALMHKVLIIIYQVLATGQSYQELGADYYDHQDVERQQRHHILRLEQLGFSVSITPISVA